MELSIKKEEAKRYNEALERASNLHKDAVEMGNNMVTKTCEIIFPELRESEDERVRKALVELISTYLRGHENGKIHGVYAKDILAWLEKQGQTFTKKDVDDAYLKGVCDAKHELEKQGEQKPVDKVEPKFKVDDVMRTKQEAADNITSGLPVIVSIDEEYYHCNNELIAIKNQDDYEYPPMNRKHNSAWGEYDCMMIDSIIQTLEIIGDKGANSMKIDWLKSIKDRVQLQPKQEWSEEDEERLSDAIFFVREYQIPTRDKRLLNAAKETEDWLRTFKDRVQSATSTKARVE